MQEGSEQILDMLFGLIAFMIVVTFAVSVYQAGNRYDDYMAEVTHGKASSNYTLAYSEEKLLLPSGSVYADIMQEKDYIEISINGNTIKAGILNEARNHDADSIRRLKELLDNAKYKKVITFSDSGEVIAVDYKREVQ